MINNYIYVQEYDSIYSGDTTGFVDGKAYLSKNDFILLENYIRSMQSDGDNSTDYYFTIYTKNGNNAIKTKNYVGTIFLKSGTSIEILPKIRTNRVEDSKKVLINMLSAVTDSKTVLSTESLLDFSYIPIFEYYIRMFIDETIRLYKVGFRSLYVEKQDNLNFFKGKLIVNENIKHNLIHREKFFVKFDEFSQNRPINRLIKSTLSYLLNKTSLWRNKKDIINLLELFDEVDYSTNINDDISKVVFDRNLSEFKKIFEWCKIFLRNKSLSAFSGEIMATSILFDMNKLFEDYVASKLKKYIMDVSIQDSNYNLFDEPKVFKIRPDIVVGTDNQIILDTKWKNLDNNPKMYGISQSDIYQMYVYQKKYKKSKEVFLLYPFSDWIPDTNIIFKSIDNESKDQQRYDAYVRVVFIDVLWDEEKWRKFSNIIVDINSNPQIDEKSNELNNLLNQNIGY